ncbi:MAG: hypothetical protein S4CHLAM20_10700 [Chlamydiia bacterium]|nr:hypothetical protein [Chlamydiia bacterium]
MFRFLFFYLFTLTSLFSLDIPVGKLSNEILSKYKDAIHQELNKEVSFQDDTRTRRSTREYGFSFFKMEQGDFSYNKPPAFLQELGASICKALGDDPVEFTNIILSYYGKEFHLEPHIDVGQNDRYKDCNFYFGEKVYGVVIEPDPTGHLYFVKYEDEGVPPLNLQPVLNLLEETGTIFCLQGPLRSKPYFHGVTNVKNQRISITFRTVVKNS